MLRFTLLLGLTALLLAGLVPYSPETFLTLRLPRILLAFISGAVLSCSGFVLQTVFRQDLASPYTFGIASASSAGACISVFFGIGAPWLFALLGSLLSVCIVLLLAAKFKLNGNSVVLGGVVNSFLFSSVIVVFHYLTGFKQSNQILRWLLGSLEVVNYHFIFICGPALLFLLYFGAKFYRELDCFSVDENTALSFGVKTSTVRLKALLFCSIAVSLVVSVVGPVGFIGLIVPHLVKRITSFGARLRLVVSLLLGGALLVFFDLLARTLIWPTELPVGVISSLVGGSFFLLVLIRKNENRLD